MLLHAVLNLLVALRPKNVAAPNATIITKATRSEYSTRLAPVSPLSLGHARSSSPTERIEFIPSPGR
ncbi:MAG: hypothetical protein R2726_06340 [Acidimicrobiales bacterium]